MSGHGKGRAKKHHEEEHENHERWAVSYSDMMTVLMALFLVLFAMSNVDQKKYLELKTSLAAGFGNESLPTDGGSGVVDGSTKSVVDLGAGTMSGAAQASDATTISSSQGKAAQDAAQEADDLARLQQQVDAQLRSQDLQSQVTTKVTEDGLVISVAANNVFFANGSATIEPAGLRVLDVVVPLLQSNDRQISVVGYTNNLAISTSQYANNWELSGARATAVLLRLNADGVAGGRLRLTGMGDQHPLFPDDDPRAFEGNRRVDIVLMAKAPSAAGATQAAALRAVAGGAQPSDVVPGSDVGAVPHLSGDAAPTSTATASS